jgi:hypothetical protein
MRKPALLLILCISPSLGHALEGYVHGDNHCFYFSSPANWIADNVSGKSGGMPFVFYPSNSSWADATTVIYTRVIDKSETIKEPEDVVKDTINLFHTKYQSPKTMAKKVGSINSKNGTKAVLYKFTGDRFGNTELVSYFVGRDTINYFVMTSREESDLNKNKHILVELSDTYREASDCVPCSEKTHNKSLNLTHNANALCAN